MTPALQQLLRNFFAEPSDQERFDERVAQLAGGIGMRSVAEAERIAADELGLHRLIAENEADETDMEYSK